MKYTDEQRKEFLIQCRRELHKIPEVGFDTKETAEFVCKQLDEMCVSHTEKYLPNSVVAIIGDKNTKPMIAVRADMDALPVREKNIYEFSSLHDGVMHACGHDAHMAMLLGVARTLKTYEKTLPFCLKMIFQPAEESETSGAKAMIDNGVLDDVDYALCQHVNPKLDTGKIGIIDGACVSACTPINIVFHGKCSHATQPQSGADAIAMAVAAYNEIQMLITRCQNPLEPVVCSVGAFHGGNAHNVLCDRVEMKISLRTVNLDTDRKFVEKIREIVDKTANVYGGTVEFEAHMSAPVSINNENLVECAVRAKNEVYGEKGIYKAERQMGSDDFAWFSQIKPSLYYWMGCRNIKKAPEGALHTDSFYLDEDCLLMGEKYLISLMNQIARM